MNIRTITEDEANDFAKREESHFFDKKSASIKGKKVQKISVAFANADGGDLLQLAASDHVATRADVWGQVATDPQEPCQITIWPELSQRS